MLLSQWLRSHSGFLWSSDFKTKRIRASLDSCPILLLCVIQEGGRTKSHRYWPKLGSKHSSATYGKFKVTTKFRTDSGCYATTGLKVKHLLSGQERTVWHLQYTDWPDHGCPEDVQGFLCKFLLPSRSFTNSIYGLIRWRWNEKRGYFLLGGESIITLKYIVLYIVCVEQRRLILVFSLPLMQWAKYGKLIGSTLI